MQDMIESDHRKRVSSSEPAYPLWGSCAVVATKTHFIANSNVADKKKSSICAVQSIVQVTHSHNPFFLRRIPFNYSCMSNNKKTLILLSVQLKGNIQIHVLLFLIIHICSNEILLFLPKIIND